MTAVLSDFQSARIGSGLQKLDSHQGEPPPQIYLKRKLNRTTISQGGKFKGQTEAWTLGPPKGQNQGLTREPPPLPGQVAFPFPQDPSIAMGQELLCACLSPLF